MGEQPVKSGIPPITKSRLVADLKRLGVASGDTLMLHASVKAVGWVVGGPDVVIQALLEVLGEEGTLMMYVGWEDSPWEAPYVFKEWPEEWQRAYLEEFPPFNPATSRAHRRWSILTEYLRTWPGAYRSGNPEASCVAVGAKAKWLTENHPLQYGYGPGSPFAKLCEAKGKVLLLGAPFGSITLLHYAEHLAKVPNKLVIRYKVPILQEGKVKKFGLKLRNLTLVGMFCRTRVNILRLYQGNISPLAGDASERLERLNLTFSMLQTLSNSLCDGLKGNMDANNP